MMLDEKDYPDQMCQVNYEYFLETFQKRYALAVMCGNVTWGHISFWRQQLNFYGGKLIGRRLLDELQHFKNKREIVDKLEDGTEIDIDSVRETIKLYNE